MSAATSLNRLKEMIFVFWLARTEQERRMLGIGAAVASLALVYVLLVAPAMGGRVKLGKALPELHQQAAEMQALASEAGDLARQPPPAMATMTRDSVAASLTGRGLTPQSLSMNGEYAKLQLNAVPFSSLITWLDAERRENRIQVQDASITSESDAGLVNATINLRQAQGGDGANGPK